MTSNRDKWDDWVTPQGSYNNPPQQGSSNWGNPYGSPGQSPQPSQSPYGQPPQSPPPPPPQPPQFQRPQGSDGDDDGGNSNLAYIVVALLVTVAVAGAAIWYLTGILGGNDSKEESAQPEVTVTETAPAGSGSDSASSDSATSESESESSTSTTQRKEHKPTPQGRSCGTIGDVEVYAVTSVTTCPFAMSVAKVVGNMQEPDDGDSYAIDAHSPVTGKTYNMNCSAKGEPVTEITCHGGNNASVQVIIPIGDR